MVGRAAGPESGGSSFAKRPRETQACRPLCNHCQDPRSRTTIQGITCGPGSSLGVTGGHVGTAGEAIWRLQKCHRGHIQKCPHRKKTCLYIRWMSMLEVYAKNCIQI